MTAPLAPCPKCSRHVKRTDAACPFCATALPAYASVDDATELEGPRLSRSAMLLVGAATVAAGCNLFNPMANIYGGPPTPPPDAARANDPVAAVYGGPPPIMQPPVPQQTDAGAPQPDAARPDAAQPVATIYGGPPPPVQPDPSHRHHAHQTPAPTPHPIPVPAYGIAPRRPGPEGM